MEQIESPSSPPPKPRRGSKLKRVVIYLLASIIIVGLSGVILYVLSDFNHRQYRLNSVGTQLRVERGLFMPQGFEVFTPQDESLRSIYASIPIPKGLKLNNPEIYDDRTDLDRALFGLLSGWTTKLLSSQNPEDFKLAHQYIERCELFPGLSETQHTELKRLRADTSFKKGEHTLEQISAQLQEALRQFQTALELGTTQKSAAEARVEEIKQQLGPKEIHVQMDLPETNQPDLIPPPLTPSHPSKAPNPAPSPTPSDSPQKWQL